MEYNRVDAFEGIDFKKISDSNEFIFLLLSLLLQNTSQLYACDGFHDLTQKSMGFGDVVIINVKENDHKIHFSADM